MSENYEKCNRFPETGACNARKENGKCPAEAIGKKCISPNQAKQARQFIKPIETRPWVTA